MDAQNRGQGVMAERMDLLVRLNQPERAVELCHVRMCVRMRLHTRTCVCTHVHMHVRKCVHVHVACACRKRAHTQCAACIAAWRAYPLC